jgi:hypothetical protein
MFGKLRTRSLVLGLIAVTAIAVIAGFIFYNGRSAGSTPGIPPGPAETVSRAVQLTTAEQAKAGLQTAVVQQEAVIMEVVTIGHVETPGRVKAEVFNADIAGVRAGLVAEITSDALPGMKLSGTVESIDARTNSQTQTTAVQIQLQTPNPALRPGMWVRTSLKIPADSEQPTVPRNAVIDTGGSRIVYVARGEGIFESRTIEIGRPSEDKYPVTSGLSAGERVVTNGAFLVDSQTRLTGGMTGLFGGSKSFSESAETTTAATHKLTFRIAPDPPLGGADANVFVTVSDAAGKSVADAQVRLTLIMPAMPSMKMPEMRSGADLRWDGKEYTGPISVSMAGPWNIVVEARKNNTLLGTYRSHTEAR